MKTLMAIVVVMGSCLAALPLESADDRGPTTTADPVGVIIGPPAGTPLAGQELDRKTSEVAALLRCPVCQGLSIADSPASMAVNMRREVRDLLAAGYSADQVLAYFEGSYGEFVRLQPPLRGFNLLVWLAPVAALLIGLFVIRRFVGRVSSASRVITTVDRSDPVVDPYVDEVRRLAYSQAGETKGRLSESTEGKS